MFWNFDLCNLTFGTFEKPPSLFKFDMPTIVVLLIATDLDHISPSQFCACGEDMWTICLQISSRCFSDIHIIASILLILNNNYDEKGQDVTLIEINDYDGSVGKLMIHCKGIIL